MRTKILISLTYLLLPLFLYSQETISESDFNKAWDFMLKIEHDEFDNYDRIYLMPTFRLKVHEEKEFDVHYWGYPMVIKYEGKDPSYFLVISYQAPDWIFIKKNESLKIIADSSKYTFSTYSDVIRETKKFMSIVSTY